MTVYTVPNGRTSTGLTLNLNDSLYVYAGGKAVSTTVNKGGYVSVSAGGTASNTTLNTSGREEDYGLDSGARVSGGSLDVFGVESSGKIFSGGTENIWGQGTDFSASITSGIQIINNGGTAISATVSSGGIQDAGFLTSNTRVVAGGTQLLEGGIASSTIVSSGGTQIVRGGTALAPIVSSGGTQVISGGAASNTTILSGGSGVLSSGTTTSAVLSGGHETLVGGFALSTSIDAGGSQIVSSGGLVHSAYINSGGEQDVYSGGRASDTVISAGGSEVVFGGGITNLAIVSGGTENISGGSANATTIFSGGTQAIYSGGSAFLTAISGGTEFVYAGGVTSNTFVVAGVQSAPGGTTFYTTVSGGARQEIRSGGTASSSTLVSGGKQGIFAGGTALRTVVSSGADVFEFAGGLASGVSLGGEELTSGGTSLATTILNGGLETIFGGTASGTLIEDGATQIVSGGTAVSGTVLNGGLEQVVGGSASGIIVQQGGEQDVFGGTAMDAAMNGAAFISGAGTLELLRGSPGGGTFTFTGSGGTLRIDGTVMPQGTIYQFGPTNTIDLPDIPGGASGYTVLGPGNLLEIVENQKFYDLHLDPARTFAAGFDGAFSLSADTQGTGTAVTFVRASTTSYAASAPPPANNPYASVVYIYAGLNEVGTGYIVGPHTVLTAAHVVWNTQAKSPYSQFTVYPGTEFGVGVVAQGYRSNPGAPVYVNPAYQSAQIFQNDFAVINVAQDLSPRGFFALDSSLWTSPSQTGTVSVTGYPDDGLATGVQHNIIALAGAGIQDSGVVSDIGLLALPSDTAASLAPGASGSPLWWVNGNTFKAVGIFVGKTSVEGVPVAVPVTPALQQQVQDWIGTYENLGITIGSGQNATNLRLTTPGHYLDVLFGGVAYGTTLDAGTVESVFGIDNNATINDGATQYIDQGGIAFNTDVADPGLQVVSSGGTAVSATLSGGIQDVYGLASATTVESGGLEIVESGGTASGTVVQADGTLELLGGAVAPGFKINSGGVLEIAAGYTLGGYQVAPGVTLDASSGGTASGATVLSGGMMELLGGAVVSGVTVNAGGVLEIGSGYGLSGYQVASGVTVEVASGGTASGVTVLSGGTLELLGGAVAQSFSVNPGGILEVASGYGLSGYEVSTGVTLEVASGGTASASKIDSGGTAIVLSGGSIGGAAFIAGGTLLLRANAAGGPVVFEGGGILEITGGSIPAGLVVSGWTPGAVLDLSAVAFSSSGTAQLGSGNVLQVAEGGSTYNVQLDPSASFAGEIFKLRSDGATGTDVTLGAVPALSVSSDANATRGQTLTLSTLVTITDASNVGYLQLELWDAIGTVAGGEFVVNGVAQSGGHEIDVAPANVGKTVFDVGTGGGTDTLWARLQQDDGSLTSWLQLTVTAPVARTPTLAVTSDNSASRGRTLALSSLVTITDPDGVGYQKLELWDSNGTAAGGQLVVNGAPQTGGHEIDLAPANVANTVFDAGTAAGTDTLWAQLLQNNGQLTGWLQFSVTVPSPTLTVSNDPSARRGQQIALSTLVAIADPGNVSYQKLELWDSNGTVAGGQFVVNGVPQTGGHEIDVAPANVANTVFDAGTAAGTDTLWAQLLQSNGQLTGWQPFSVTVPFPSLTVTSDPNATRGQQVALSQLVTIADPAQVGFQKLELWDSIGTAAGGQFVVNNSPQTGGHEIDVAPGDVAKTVFDVGTLGGTDMLWAQLLENNGQVTGWQPFTVSAPAAQLPILTVNNFAGASAAQTIALSTLVTITDPDHVGYQKLELWDSNGTAQAGQFVINNSPQGGGHEIDVNPGDVGNSKFDVGTSGATDTLWARLLQDNGTLTAWQQFTVKDPITIAAGATVEISSAYAGSVTFAADTGTLQLDNSASFSGTVGGLTGSDTVDFADIDPTKVQMPSYAGDASGGTLSVSDGTHSANIALLGNYLASTFTAASDGHGGTAVIDPAVLGGVQPLVTPSHA